LERTKKLGIQVEEEEVVVEKKEEEEEEEEEEGVDTWLRVMGEENYAVPSRADILWRSPLREGVEKLFLGF
jgi:hypothetical protein